MYKFRTEKREELLKGLKIRYVAGNLVNMNRSYVTSVIDGKKGCGKRLANRLIKNLDKNNKGLDYFFYEEGRTYYNGKD